MSMADLSVTPVCWFAAIGNLLGMQLFILCQVTAWPWRRCYFEENFYVYELPKTLANDQSIYRYIILNLLQTFYDKMEHA